VGECKKMERTEGADVTLYLPRDIKEYKSIGVYDYERCSNYAHLEIPASGGGFPTAGAADIKGDGKCESAYNPDDNILCDEPYRGQ